SLLFPGLVAAGGLGLNLLFLTIYLICLCGCKRDEESETKRPSSCCITEGLASLAPSAAVGIGFYGNSETNDGVYQLIYALDNANHTLSGIDTLTPASCSHPTCVCLSPALSGLPLFVALAPGQSRKQRLSGWLAADGSAPELVRRPPWLRGAHDPTHQAFQSRKQRLSDWLLARGDSVSLVWLVSVGEMEKGTCPSACPAPASLALAQGAWHSCWPDRAAARGTSDFCVAPDKFIMNLTQGDLSAGLVTWCLGILEGWPQPWVQALTIYQRSLTTMQIQIQGLLQFAVPLFPTARKDLLGIQQLLNSSETSLHQLTAMLDCRGLHKDYLDGLMGICYDGVEGLLYLALFSLLAAMSFSTLICATPRAWKHLRRWCPLKDRDYDDIDEEDPFNPQARRIATHNPTRGQLRSFCSYSSSLGSQASLHPPAQTVSNAPVSEYMNQAALFGGNPRYENVPLIGRGSPPPTYSPSMRATYLSVNDEHIRHYGNEFPA
uniref:Protein tweety homolog n=1 Tax=Pelodiscus sinensis TaxID=13735 RepID=K7FSB7_PELSI